MKMIRPIVYSIIGAVVGLIAGFLIEGLIFSDATTGNILLVVPLVCAVILGYACYRFGNKMSVMQDRSEKSHGYFSVANTIGAFILVIPAVISVGATALAPTLTNSFVISLGITIASVILATWLGVRYASKKGTLLSIHDPMKTSVWVTGLFAVLYVIFYGLIAGSQPSAVGTVTVIGVIVNLVVIGAAVYFFVQAAFSRTVASAAVASL
ncbi:MAG: hypothetical protein JWM46_627 [Candidatus Kaiserbacteria bacterium]|nr:hypothetical protein [Candidatus Kaiserbacteria bacterium]